MALVLKSLDDDGAERRIEDGTSFAIGRGPDNDLVLVDPSREISKTHCRIESDGKSFVLTDLSINGVTIEGQSAPMGPGARHILRAGDVFTIGRQRFAVTMGGATGEDAARAPPVTASPVSTAPQAISHILDGSAEGIETRDSHGVTEAEAWLGTLPTGSARDTMHEPMGWETPPAKDGDAVLPLDFDHDAASDFASRSEHVPAQHGALHLPQAQQVIPTDWLDEEPVPGAAAPAAKSTGAGADTAALRGALADGGRFDPGGLAGLTDEDLMRRCGAALRAFLDGFDTAEAAQAVAERDCGLSTPSESGLWTDFFATNRDPILSLLAEPHPGPAQVLGQRAAKLADRQRALGHAVAEAAHTYDAVLTPAAIEAETKSRSRPGPLAKVAAWKRFVGLHHELRNQEGAGNLASFLILLRKSFARATTKRP